MIDRHDRKYFDVIWIDLKLARQVALRDDIVMRDHDLQTLEVIGKQ